MIDPLLKDEAPAATDRTIRQFAGLWLLLFGVWAFSYGYSRGQVGTAVWLSVLAAAIGIPGLLRPRIVRPVFLGAMVLTAPIGRTVSYVVLALLFYGVFTPVAVIFRLVGRDALRRRHRHRETHWVPKPTAADVRSYFRQS